MTDRLLEEIVHDMDKDFAGSKSIKDRFVEVGNEYINQADDPTTQQIKVLVDHFEETPSDEIDENTLAFMWTMSSILQWMIDDLPLQGQMRDPEWLREKLELWDQ